MPAAGADVVGCTGAGGSAGTFGATEPTEPTEPVDPVDPVDPADPADPAERSGAEVQVVDLTWRPFGRKQPVLSHLDLTIRPGERVLLAGPSGSGKSTLLRALAGLLLTADAGELSGTVTVDGVDPQLLPGAVGLVLQDPGAGIVASRIGRDVAFGLENVRVPAAGMPPVISEVLAEVGLTMAQDASPSTLSGGESQRLALAGALALSPQVLLLDEPTAMLDAATAATVRRVVDTVVARRGLTLVVVEHRLDGWVDLVDRLIVLDDSGVVVADGEPSRVLAAEAESLAAQGIWVPGVPPPPPLALDVPMLAGSTAGLVARGTAVVTGEGVTVEHRSRRLGEPSRSTVAVRDTDLSVPAGATVALVGPSGAGKSTLMSALGGLVELSSGSVALAEAVSPRGDAPPEKWASIDLARTVAWVPQRAATSIVGRTVREDVLTTPYAVGLDPDLAAHRVDALLQALGLAQLAQVDPRNLSGGEQRRLAVAAAVAHGPALVLADEPTVGQDRLTWSAVMGVLDLARREGSGVLVTTHDPGVIDAADQVVHLEPPICEPRPEPGTELVPAPGPAPGPGRVTDAARESVTRPLLGRVGPLALLGVGLSVLPLPALLGNWRHGLLVLAVELVLGSIGLLAPGPGRAPEGRLRGLLLRLAPAGLAVLGVAWSAWLLGGRDLEVAAGAALRVLCLIVPSAFVVGFIDPDALGDHLAQRLRLPARPVVAATAALQRLQSLDTLWAELMRTRRVRGIRADRGLVRKVREAGEVTVGLLLGALGQAATLALAMDARGFAQAQRRTWAGPAPWRGPDWLAMLAGVLVIATAVVARQLWPG